MKQVSGIQMQLPEGKLPGFYAQIIKGIAEHAAIVDRSGELMFAREEHTEAINKVLRHYKVDSTTSSWLQLTDSEWSLGRLWDDYGITARAGGWFADLQLAAAGNLLAIDNASETEQAWLQIEEHHIAMLQKDSRRSFVVDRQLSELIDGIARAYRCHVEWLF
ncbi:hypothetical protein AB6A23_10105 [Paenibacillus tarimensis]